MFILLAAICLLLLLAFAGADMFVAGLNADELSHMGIDRKSYRNG